MLLTIGEYGAPVGGALGEDDGQGDILEGGDAENSRHFMACVVIILIRYKRFKPKTQFNEIHCGSW